MINLVSVGRMTREHQRVRSVAESQTDGEVITV
jgi:hypothetical protein